MRETKPAYKATPDPDEARYVARAKSGDSEAFAHLYDTHVERVYRYIYFRVSDDMLAEDLTSQVFLKAWENLGKYKSNGSPFVAWLYTIARNLVIDHHRTQKESVPLDRVIGLASADELEPEQQAELRSVLQDVRGALQLLTEDQQQVLTLKFIAGLSNEEIAKTMKKREGAIRALQMRALQALSKHLERNELT